MFLIHYLIQKTLLGYTNFYRSVRVYTMRSDMFSFQRALASTENGKPLTNRAGVDGLSFNLAIAVKALSLNASAKVFGRGASIITILLIQANALISLQVPLRLSLSLMGFRQEFPLLDLLFFFVTYAWQVLSIRHLICSL